VKVIFKSIRDFFKDDGVVLASYISYSFMLASAPLIIFIISLFGHLLGSEGNLYVFLFERLTALFPKATEVITGELKKLAIYRVVGRFSLILYLGLSMQLFFSLQHSIDRVFKEERKSPVIRTIFFSFIVITSIMVALFASFFLFSIIKFIGTLTKGFPWLKTSLGFFIKYIIPFLIVVFVCLVLYIFLPKKEVRFKNAIFGAVFTAIMGESAKHLFSWYISSITGLGTIYGALSAFIVFLLWCFYFSSIFLVGAEIVNNLTRRER